MRKITRHLIRETVVTDRVRSLIIELHPGFVVFRLKRTRYRFSIDWYTLHRVAQKKEAERIVAKRKAKQTDHVRGEGRTGER